jgi:uncharacterized protein YdhG (YjbR/CyaY superfamily)
MEPGHATLTTVDEYIAAFPSEIQSILQNIRSTIKREVPEAAEKLSYNMTTFFLKRDIVHFGAFKNHIGLFPPVRNPELKTQTIDYCYCGEKGTLRFPLDQPIPYELIGKIVKVRVREIREKEVAKRRGKQGA